MLYNQYVDNERRAYQQRATEYNENLTAWQASNDAMHAYLQKPLLESKKLLTEFYRIGKIYPKYHNLPALTSIYEYFITGRCDELTGPHGAYNMYEDEVRKDRIISQMSVIISQLEQIKNNQYMLYEQVKEIQQNTQVIARELEEIKGYTVQITALTAMNAYYAALNEENTRITAVYHLLC